MTLLCKKVDYRNYETLSPQQHTSKQLSRPRPLLGVRGKGNGTFIQGPRPLPGTTAGDSTEIVFCNNGTPAPWGPPFPQNTATTMQEFFQDTALSFQLVGKFPLCTASPCPPIPILSTPGSRQQVTGSSTVSQSHRAMVSQSRGSKTKKQLETLFNCWKWINLLIKSLFVGTKLCNIKCSSEMNQVLTTKSLNTKVRLLKYAKRSLNAFLTHKLLLTCF